MTKALTPRTVFDRATLALHFDTLSSPAGFVLTHDPAVHAGIELSSAEAERSATRGGDGRAAALDGGAVSLKADSRAAGPQKQHELSFCVRACDPSGGWNARLLSDLGADDKPRITLSATGTMLVFELFTDYRDQALKMSVPLSSVGATEWHDIVGRYSGPHVELYVDGVVVDEEWPVGCLAGEGRAKILIGGPGADGTDGTEGGFQGLLDHVAVWDRALSNGEIEALCGGPDQAALRQLAGPSTGAVQYRGAPGGGNVGDCFPFFHEGVLHFYYLLDRRHHGSKFGLGAHQWAHSSSRDLVSWNRHPLAVPITEESEGSICTGSVFFHEGSWYAFYATRLMDRSEHVSLAVGADGIRFQKVGQIASPRPPYRPGPFRDPHVFRDPSGGRFHMLVTAELAHPGVAGRGGCLAHLVSSDLRSWEQQEPFLVTGYGDQPECPELFEWRGWYYLVFSHFGVAHYRMARGPFGPWTRPRVDCLDGPLARVMKSAPFTGDRRIGAFFLAEDGYAGAAVFREILQGQDGTLACAWPQETVPRAGPAISTGIEPLGPGVAGSPSGIRIESPQGFSAAALTGLPRRYILSLRVTAQAPAYAFGLGVRGRGNFRDTLALEFAPPRRRVGWRHPGKPSWQEEETAALYEVEGLDGPFGVQIIVLDDILDLCIDGKRTLINRAKMGNGDRLFFYCHESTCDFQEISVRPLAEE